MKMCKKCARGGKFSLKNTHQTPPLNCPGVSFACFIVILRGACAQNARNGPCRAFLCFQKTRFAYKMAVCLPCVLFVFSSENLPFRGSPGHFSLKKAYRFHSELFCKRYVFYSEMPVAEPSAWAGFVRNHVPNCIKKGALGGPWDTFSSFRTTKQVQKQQELCLFLF